MCRASRFDPAAFRLPRDASDSVALATPSDEVTVVFARSTADHHIVVEASTEEARPSVYRIPNLADLPILERHTALRPSVAWAERVVTELGS